MGHSKMNGVPYCYWKMLVSQMCFLNQININGLTGHSFCFFVPRRSNSIEGGGRRKNGLGSRKTVNQYSTPLVWKLKFLCFVELLKFV